MTSHNWEFISPEISNEIESIDYDISISEPLHKSHGTYACSRCGDVAAVYINKPGLSGISSNWDSDCDETVIRRIHAS